MTVVLCRKCICYCVAFLLLLLPFAAFAQSETPEQKLKRGHALLRSDNRQAGVAVLQELVNELQGIFTTEATAEAREEQDEIDAERFVTYGLACFYLEKDEEALKAFRAALAKNSKLPVPHFFQGLIYRYAGNWDQAVEQFTAASNLAPTNPDYWFELGRALTETRKVDEALRAYQKTLLYDKNHVQALYNSGQIYQAIGEHAKALSHFTAVLNIDPLDWQAKARTIQEYQAMGRLVERDQARQELLAMRKDGSVKTLAESKLYCREQLTMPQSDIAAMVYEYFELQGDFARRYLFRVYEKQSGTVLYEISLGSYKLTDAIAHELGEVKQDERLFHLDGYCPGGSHVTFGFSINEPDYDKVRNTVIEILLEGGLTCSVRK